MPSSELIECDVPLASALHPRMVASAYFRDAYRAPLIRPRADVIDIFFGIFGHHPIGIKLALILRNRIARWFGLSVASDASIMAPRRQPSYAVGDTVGPWPIFSITENELIVGRNNGHLDFRLSILREPDVPDPSVTVSTVCIVHNRYGKAYLFLITPFHRWGVRFIIARAVRAGRL